MIDPNWRPKGYYIWLTSQLYPVAPGQAVKRIFEAMNAGDLPPCLEDIPAVVEAVTEKHSLVELAADQWPPPYHSDYGDKSLFALICDALRNAGFRRVKL